MAAKDSDNVFSLYPVIPKEDKNWVHGERVNVTVTEIFQNADIAFFLPLDQVDGLKNGSIGTPNQPLKVYGGYFVSPLP